MIEVLIDGKWVTVQKEAAVDPGWVRFRTPDGQEAIAAPGRWREKQA